jgi:hypothetical protein
LGFSVFDPFTSSGRHFYTFVLEGWNFETKNVSHVALREYNQNFILASSSRLMEILFVSKRNDHPVPSSVKIGFYIVGSEIARTQSIIQSQKKAQFFA